MRLGLALPSEEVQQKKRLRHYARLNARRLLSLDEAKGVSIQRLILEGSPFVEIGRTVRAEKVAVVVMGSTGVLGMWIEFSSAARLGKSSVRPGVRFSRYRCRTYCVYNEPRPGRGRRRVEDEYQLRAVIVRKTISDGCRRYVGAVVPRQCPIRAASRGQDQRLHVYHEPGAAYAGCAHRH